MDTNVPFDLVLTKEWEWFDLQIKGQSDTQTVITLQSPLRQQPIVHDPMVEKASTKDSTIREVEIIPENPSSEIILSIEEIPLLDVFYSPKYRAVVKRQRKKRKIYQVQQLSLKMNT